VMMIHDEIKVRRRTTPGESFEIQWPIASASRASVRTSGTAATVRQTLCARLFIALRF
jgi:hypothetical protein